MIKAVILGCSIYSDYLNQFIYRGYNKIIGDYGGEPLEVVAFWDYFENGIKDISGYPVVTRNELKDMIATSKADV